MQHALLGIAAGLSDVDLLRRLPQLAGREREVTVELLAHIAELDKRRLHVSLGYGSLFAYCTGALRLAEHAAYNRIEAARASRRFPEILDRLATGTLNLSTLRLLAPHLTAENHRLVLDEAAGKSKRDVELLVARLVPRPDAPPVMRRLTSRETVVRDPSMRSDSGQIAAAEMAVVGTDLSASSSRVEASTVGSEAAGTRLTADGVPTTCLEPMALLRCAQANPIASSHRSQITPLAPERYRLQVTVDREAHDSLRRLQDLLRREIPDGDPGRIVERALRLLMQDVAREKVAAVSRPRTGTAGAVRSRHVPAQVKRTVWLRDGGRCAFVSRGGRRCGERAYLEFHHVEPYALGGETSASNLALRCRAHNRYEAELVFGRERTAYAESVRPAQLVPGRVVQATRAGHPAAKPSCAPDPIALAARRWRQGVGSRPGSD